MAGSRSAWGIDIGNRALKAVKLVRDNARLRVDDVEVIEHEQILSSAGDNRDNLIQTALANFVQRHGTKGSVVGISTSGQSSFARFIKLPPVEPKKIPEIVKFEAIQQIPFPLEDVEWSYQLFQDPESPDIEVGIFAMRKELVNAQIKQFTDLEMNVQVVQMSPLSVYNAMYYDQHLADGTTMIVDCGAENTDLIIADGETVWLRTISIGGNNFTESLTKSFKLNFPKAEELKRNAATSKYQRQIFQAMRPVFADFVSEIQRSIGFYGTVHREARIKRIIALGSTFRLPTLQKYLQQNLQVEVARLDGFSGGAPADGRLAAMLNENMPSLCTAYGLAVQAMGDAKITSSLLPETIRQAKVWKEKTPWFGLAAACFVLGTAAAAAKWYIDQQQFEGKSPVRTNVDRTISQANAADAAWMKTQDEGKPDRDRIQQVTGLQTGRDIWQRLVQDIGAAVPPPPTDIEALKKIPRPDRTQVVIDSMSSEYQPDMAKLLAMSDHEFKRAAGVAGTPDAAATGRDPVTDAAAAAPVNPTPLQNARGYLVTVRCTTPNKGGPLFVKEAFLRKLEQLTAEKAFKEKKPYYIAKATIVDAQDVKASPHTIASDTGDSGGGGQTYVRSDPIGGRGGERAPADVRAMPRVANATIPDATTLIQFPDPLTGEEMADDSSLVAVIAVVLDPPPPAPKDGTAPAEGARTSAQ